MRSEVEQSKMMFSTPIEQPQQDKWVWTSNNRAYHHQYS
jgi:hypothetical protein